MKRVSPKKMSHVVYRTYRFDQMISWYEVVFGARVGNRSAALAFLTFDDEDHRFAIANLQILKPDHLEPGLGISQRHSHWINGLTTITNEEV